MRNFLIGVLALLASTTAHAGSFFKYGLGVFGSAEYGAATVKYFGLGYEDRLLGPFIEQFEFGLFADTSGHDRKTSGFGFYSIGVETNPGYFVIRSLFGIGAITSPDTMLGGHFQFTEDLFLGVRDDRGCMIGLNLKHISSAGLSQPNKGRDFLVIQVEIPW
jgi:hypothetical protein